MGKSNNSNVIRCRAKNCEYHSGECDCLAHDVEVGHTHASKSAETECSTFVCRNDCDCGCGGC